MVAWWLLQLSPYPQKVPFLVALCVLLYCLQTVFLSKRKHHQWNSSSVQRNLFITAFIIWGRSKGGSAGGQGETQWTPHAEVVISKTYSYYKKSSKNYFKMTKIPFSFSKHFDLTGNHTYFLRELVPRPPRYSLSFTSCRLKPFYNNPRSSQVF